MGLESCDADVFVVAGYLSRLRWRSRLLRRQRRVRYGDCGDGRREGRMDGTDGGDCAKIGEAIYMRRVRTPRYHVLYHGFPLSRFDIGSCAVCLYFRSSGLAALWPTWYSQAFIL